MPDTGPRIFTAHDIRGTVPGDWDGADAYRIGAHFADLTGAPVIALARDNREPSTALAQAFARGVRDRGAEVVDAGLGPADYLAFVSGTLDVPAAMVTAGHRPPGYGGIRLFRASAVPVTEGTGLETLRERVAAGGRIGPVALPGAAREVDLLLEYAAWLRSLVPGLDELRPLTVVVDAGNGTAGLTAPLVLDHPAVDVVPLRFELDGRFPHRHPDPLAPHATDALRERVVAEGADLGLALGADGGCCVAVDERGAAVPPPALYTLLAVRALDADPGAAVVHDLLVSPTAVAAVEEAGGRTVRSRVGHPEVRELMAEHKAVFGGDHRGHHCFRDLWGAGSGMLAALHVLAAVGTERTPLSALVRLADFPAASGETEVAGVDPEAALRAVEDVHRTPGTAVDHLDGLTVTRPDGAWFNLRSSRGEPVLRLNAEAATPDAVRALTRTVLQCVESAR
ncbi:phosphomannomutase/phosphoglucomutase [Streptomyces sp. MS06]|uniref:phosphomannomutase/phosphoglucomutase n=1 Tax=Streptomyces sp. MS06 TaxID=3385974 RepID=UPI0039A29E8D